MGMGRFGVLTPLGRLKWIDRGALEARFGAGADKVVASPLRPVSWTRVAKLLERPPSLDGEKLPLKRPRGAKLPLFRAFKILGGLKRARGAEVS